MTSETELEQPPERQPPHNGRRSRFPVIVVAALATLVAVDLAAWQLAPPRHLREVEDAMRDLDAVAPTALAIGSSHARTFAVLSESLSVRTAGRQRLLAVPVEWGKLSSYRWVLERRILPLLDAHESTGGPRLELAYVVTEWWDSCADTSPPKNLPARSWTWRHYAEDVRANGFTSYNANFLGYRFSRRFRWSALVQDRGHGRLTSALRQRLLPSDAGALQANFDVQVEMWRQMVVDGARCVGTPEEMADLEWIVDALQRRGAKVRVVLYPRMPATLTAEARRTTLPAFVDSIATRLDTARVPIVDLTEAPILTDADFGEDFDHLVRSANARLSHWLLEGPLRELMVVH